MGFFLTGGKHPSVSVLTLSVEVVEDVCVKLPKNFLKLACLFMAT
jgi:hypothetical protein